MAAAEDHAEIASSSGEVDRLALSLVGDRGYVRALELVSQMRHRFPDAILEFRFRRPMTCDVAITKVAESDWSSQVTIEIGAKREKYFVVNLDSKNKYRTPNSQLIPHFVLLFRKSKQRYLTFGSDECGLLDLILETYQRRTNIRWVVVSIKMVRLPVRSLQFVTVDVEMLRRHWLKGRITVNSHHWAEIYVRSREI
jgi:hypothetical protein